MDTEKNNRNAAQLEKMTKTPVKKLICSMAVPTIISMIITAVYNMADTYFVSQLGTSASGAVSIVFSLMAMIQAFGFTIGMGSGSMISRFLGASQNDEADSCAASAVGVATLIGLIITSVGLGFLEDFMRLIGSSETMLPYTTEYGRYILISAPFMLLTFVMNNIMRSCGKAKYSMVGIMSGSILNMALDPILIFVAGMGISGAGIATCIGQITSFSVLALMFILGKCPVRIAFKNISFDGKLYLKIISNGLPSFCRQGLASVSSVLINGTAVVYGDFAVASLGIVTKVFMMIFSVVLGFGQGYQPVCGYNYGAKKYGRVYEAMKFTFAVKMVIMSVLALLGFIFARSLVTMFISDDPQVIETGTLALRIQCFSMPLIPFSTIANMTFQSIGKSWTSTLLSSTRQGIFYIPAVFILPALYGLDGVVCVQTVADLFSAALCVPFLVSFIRKLKLQIAEETTGGV